MDHAPSPVVLLVVVLMAVVAVNLGAASVTLLQAVSLLQLERRFMIMSDLALVVVTTMTNVVVLALAPRRMTPSKAVELLRNDREAKVFLQVWHEACQLSV